MRLNDKTLVYNKNYRIPESQTPEIQSQVDKLIRDGIVEPSISDYHSLGTQEINETKTLQETLQKTKVISPQQNKNYQLFIGQLIISDHTYLVGIS